MNVSGAGTLDFEGSEVVTLIERGTPITPRGHDTEKRQLNEIHRVRRERE